MELPNQLRLGIERELRDRAPAALTRDAAALMASYRQGGRGRVDPVAYAAVRMPATFAAVAAALRATVAAAPGFAPRTQLDVGAGTGAALWAGAATWASLEAATLIEVDPQMRELGARLATGGRGALPEARWLGADLLGPWEAGPHDLVTAAYALGELPEGGRPAVVERLWGVTAGALLIVEPGTPRGWATVRVAREQLRSAGAQLLAPCPHQGDCPLPANPEQDWCHFAERLARSRALRQAKGAALGFEDEKYAYIVAARLPGERVAARVLRHPVSRPGRIELALCARDGLRRALVTKADQGAWRVARALAWGDGLGPDVTL